MSQPLHLVVLGGTGFVGRHLVPRLHAAGHRIDVLSRNRERHRELGVLPRVRVRSVDVYDAAALADALCGADAAINLIGILNERGRDGSGFRRAHVDLTRTLLDACARAGVTRLLQMSALRAGEGSSHYLRTRGEAEALVRASATAWTLFRPSVIFGPGDGLYFRFAALLRLAPLLPLARATARFAPVYVGDVVEAMQRSLASAASIGAVYELGGPQRMSLAEIVRDTARWCGLHRAVLPLPDALGRLQAALMDFVPGKPFSSDNFRSLQLDSVPEEDGLAALGIVPTPAAAVMPGLLAPR